MHMAMGEPELLAQLLVTLAQEHARYERQEAWAIVARHAEACVADLERANETPARR
jgi:hypothetical protein